MLPAVFFCLTWGYIRDFNTNTGGPKAFAGQILTPAMFILCSLTTLTGLVLLLIPNDGKTSRLILAFATFTAAVPGIVTIIWIKHGSL